MTENVELEEQMTLFENEEDEAMEQNNDLDQDNEFKEAVYTKMRQIHNEGMIVGFQTACHTALNKIYSFEKKAGKKSMNDYKRCIKDLKQFFETGIELKVTADESSATEENAGAETVQN